MVRPSKSFLERSLFAVYKELLLEEVPDKLTEEVHRLAADRSLFTPPEIRLNKKRLTEMAEMSAFEELDCFIDGSVKVWYDNPRQLKGRNIESSSAFIVKSGEKVMLKQAFPIPKKYQGEFVTSHTAEYQALVSCLRVLSIYHAQPKTLKLTVYTDSDVLSKQLNMEALTRNKDQRMMREEARSYFKHFAEVTIQHFSRDENEEADALARKARTQEIETFN